jgi:SET domain-containing protein
MQYSKLELLRHLNQEVYCRLRPSGSHGVGVFAIKDIPAGINPFPGAFEGTYIEVTEEELRSAPHGVQEMIRAYCVCEDGLWLVPNEGLNRIDVSFFINHSKNPNVATEDGEIFITLRAIKVGEEIVSDYDQYSEGFK